MEIQFPCELEQAVQENAKLSETQRLSDALQSLFEPSTDQHGLYENQISYAVTVQDVVAVSPPTETVVEIEGRVELGSANIDAIEGNADKITRVVERRRGSMKHCYDQALRQDPALEGRIIVGFVVSKGRVQDAQVSSNSTGNQDLARCIELKFRRMRFVAGIEAEVRYPIVLTRLTPGEP